MIGQFQLPDHRMDNSVVLARQARRKAGVLSSLGDYPAALPNQIIATKGAAEQGPVTSPTIAPADATDLTSQLAQIIALLQRMPFALSTEFRKRFIVEPREAVAFCAPGGPTNVPAAAAVAIVTVQVNERYTGFLTYVGIMAAPAALAQIRWQIRINGSVHPKFANNFFPASNIATPYPFDLELCQNAQVQLVAINTGGAGVDVSGLLLGWTEFMTSSKTYGGAPSSGIG